MYCECGCGQTRFPALRLAIENGITLCKVHHLAVKGKEQEWVSRLELLVGGIAREANSTNLLAIKEPDSENGR